MMEVGNKVDESTEAEGAQEQLGSDTGVDDQEVEDTSALLDTRGGAQDPFGGDAQDMRAAPEEPELFLQKYFTDHFTLPTPSSTVRFRSANTAARVFENKATQFILEETYDPENGKRRIQVKRLKNSTRGLQFLRACYTIVCVLWTGIFFVLCLQVLLIMVLELAIQFGTTGLAPELSVWRLIGVILAIIVMCLGFASALVIAGAYVSDTWSGHFLVKQFFFTRWFSEVFVDWIFFVFFALLPALVLCVALLYGYDEWWQITALFWFACVSFFFVIFAISSVFYEVQGAFNFVKQRPDGTHGSFLSICKRCILLKQVHTYSGKKNTKYLARSVFQHPENGPAQHGDIFDSTRRERVSPWSKFTLWSYMSTDSPRGVSLFRPLDPPVTLYTIDDVQGNRPFVTKYTWSLERLFCRPRNSRYVAVVHGPGALTGDQIKSSLVCSGIGTLLTLLLTISFLVWMAVPALFVVIVAAVFLAFAFPFFKDIGRLWKVASAVLSVKKDMLAEGNGPDSENSQPKSNQCLSSHVRMMSSRRPSELDKTPNEGVYLVSQYERVTEATELYCWTMLVLEIAVFFVYPVVVLFEIGDGTVGLLFVGVSVISSVRYYINLVTVIEETGHMSLVDGRNAGERWANQSRLSDIIEAISYDKSRRVWTTVLGAFAVIVVALFLGAVGGTTDPTFNQELTFLSDFYYPPQSVDIRYTTCRLSNSDLFGENATLADFAFLSSLPYKTNEIAESELKGWFREADIVEDRDTVDEFRHRTETVGLPVFFRLFRSNVKGSVKDRGIISIRGTQNNWDLLADSQLWSTAILVQGLRALLPVGEAWTPILDELVQLINLLQSEAIGKISFYKVTTEFAEELKEDPSFETVQLTGHSLGGGLAIISGAQSRLPAVALSGPNAMLSGKSFNPQVFPEELNRYTFNIVPDRDIVARFDDVADQFQRIRCTAPANDFVKCHDFTRSLCEIIYTCGTGDRPALCECHTLLGYPKPTTDGEQNFDDLCPPPS